MSGASGLPIGWVATRLELVATVVRGVSFPASAKLNGPGPGRVRCLRTSNVQETLETQDVLYISESYVGRGDQWVQPGDVLISIANSYELVGKVAFASVQPEPTTFGAFIAAIRARDIEPKFLMYQLRSSTMRTAMRSGASQTVNIANLSLGTLNPLTIRVPPRPEQRRIAFRCLGSFTRVTRQNSSRRRTLALNTP